MVELLDAAEAEVKEELVEALVVEVPFLAWADARSAMIATVDLYNIFLFNIN